MLSDRAEALGVFCSEYYQFLCNHLETDKVQEQKERLYFKQKCKSKAQMCILLIVIHFYDSTVAFQTYLVFISDNYFIMAGKASVGDSRNTVSITASHSKYKDGTVLCNIKQIKRGQINKATHTDNYILIEFALC